LKSFEFYVKNNDVVRAKNDKILADSILYDADKRFSYYSMMSLTDTTSKFVVENIYEAIRGVMDSILALRGYKSYSHEACIVFAKEQGYIEVEDAVFLNNLRRKRNRSKYAEEPISQQYAEHNLSFAKKIYNKMKHAAEKLIN